jgi:alpha/beta superfamily hydrolase
MTAQHKFSIPSASGVLHGVVHMPQGVPRAIAVVAHPLPTMGGTMDNKIVTTLVKTFAGLGFVALRFNFRGVGDSSGVYDDGNGEVEDVLAIVQYAMQEFGPLPLILSGFSFGGYVQARAAEQLHPQKLVLVAPAVGRFAMPPVPADTLLIHGEMDEVVALSEVMAWARSQHFPIVVVPEATHFFHGHLHQIKAIVSQHFIGHNV